MPTEPSKAEMFFDIFRSQLLDVHVAIPARVDSYDAATQTCKCTPVVRRARLNDNREIIKEDLPQFSNVPVDWTRGGGFFVTLPLAKGDFVQLLFNEVGTGVFRTSGDVPSNPGEIRRHSLSDPVAIPGGAYPDAQPVGDASATDMVLGKDGDAIIRIQPNGNILIGRQAIEKIARADRADAENVKIQSAFSAHVHIVPSGTDAMGGVTGPSASYTPASVAADKGFVE